MAYNSSYNPDALPAHAEPEQAAALLSGQIPQKPRPPRRSSPGPQYQHRQSPNQPQNDHYNRSYPPPNNQTNQAPGGYGRGSGGAGRGYGPQQGYGGPQNHGAPHAEGGYSKYSQSPPPQNYGFGQPPQFHHNRPPPVSRPPPTPALGAPPGGDAALFPLFKAVDKDGSGQLSERELRAALVNGDWTSFDPYTVKMMIRMFDTDRSGTIGFDEFCGLWAFLASWRSLFDRFDEDGSGNISFDEYSKALLAFGYRLSPQFVQVLFRAYDKRGENAISFDLFVQSCISLKRMTDVFKKYDDDRDGYITLSFEEFLTEILRQR